MSVLDHFSLPLAGMKDGLQKYHFSVDNSFFEVIENSLICDGIFEIDLDYDKRPNMSVLDFHIKGSVAATCDRCLSDIRLPIDAEYQLHVKVSSQEEDDDEVIFIKDDQVVLNLTQHIYEYICISLPLVNVYDCENEVPKMCNEDVLQKLNIKEEAPIEERSKSIWDSLKNIDPDKLKK